MNTARNPNAAQLFQSNAAKAVGRTGSTQLSRGTLAAHAAM